MLVGYYGKIVFYLTTLGCLGIPASMISRVTYLRLPDVQAQQAPSALVNFPLISEQ